MELKEQLDKIKSYWDEWITQWYIEFININVDKIDHSKKIKDKWTVPTSHLGNVTNDSSGRKVYYPAYKYFPEPYWGNIIGPSKLECVFLNINPGGGGENQLYGVEEIDIESEIQCIKEKFTNNKDFKYSNIVEEFSREMKYETTKWMLNKRIKWLNDIDGQKRISLENNLFFDLVPWHTPSKQDIQDYCISHSKQIFDQVLSPISSLGEHIEGRFKNKIIVRGSTILDLFNTKEFSEFIDRESIQQFVVVDKNIPLFKLSSLMTMFKLKDLPSTFYVFSGGASMMLPNPDYFVYDIKKSNEISKTLRDHFPEPTANSV